MYTQYQLLIFLTFLKTFLTKIPDISYIISAIFSLLEPWITSNTVNFIKFILIEQPAKILWEIFQNLILTIIQRIILDWPFKPNIPNFFQHKIVRTSFDECSFSYLSFERAVKACRRIGTTEWSRYCLVGKDCTSVFALGLFTASFSSLMIF